MSRRRLGAGFAAVVRRRGGARVVTAGHRTRGATPSVRCSTLAAAVLGLAFAPAAASAQAASPAAAASAAQPAHPTSPETARSAAAGRPIATLADFAWLEGTWRGEGPGGAVAEVHYMAPAAGVLPSVFRLYSQARVMVLEAVTLVEDEDGITLYVRHFTPALVPLEKERALALRLVSRDGDRYLFENLYDENPRRSVFERTGPDTFLGWSELLRQGGRTDEIRVEYRRVQ